MPKRLQDCEDALRRQVAVTAEGTIYRRFYNVDQYDLDQDPPAEGDMLPGETTALLGPFVMRGGIGWQRQREGGKQLLTLSGITLREKSGESGNYNELDRRIVAGAPNITTYRTLGIALLSTEDTAPSRGDELSGTTETVVPLCVSVQLDGVTYPQRFLFVALWEAPQVK